MIILEYQPSNVVRPPVTGRNPVDPGSRSAPQAGVGCAKLRDFMTLHVRRTEIAALKTLVSFAIFEAKEAEGLTKEPERVREGIRTALINDSVAMYWVLENDKSELIGNISVVKEWSDWNCAYYWWIQSMYILPEFRGRGLIEKLIEDIRAAARQERALELRLYVHKKNERAIKAYKKSGFSDSNYQIMTMKI